jgi:SAM-dependent methyltransferase
LSRLPDDVLALLRQRLTAARFDEDIIAECETIVPGQLDRIRVPLVHSVLEARGDATGVITQLFMYQGTVTRPALEQALGSDLVAALERASWLACDDTGVRTRVRVVPFFGVWIACDECPTHEEPVMGAGASTALLARAIELDGVTSLLDIGCGAGALALFAAKRGVPDVMGVDLDPRAVAYGRLNARLNELSASWGVGDLTAPAAGRRFDAVVAQPPFVTHPDGVEGTMYLHGGVRGDELTMRLLGELEHVLSDRGRALVFFESADPAAELRDRVRAAVPSDAFHVIVVFGAGHTPDRLAVAYAALTEPSLDERYGLLARRYRDHLTALGIANTRHLFCHAERVPTGGRTRPYTVVLEPPTLKGYDAAGFADLRRALEVVALDDESLLRCRIRPARGASIVHEQSLDDPERRRLRAHFEHGRGTDHELSDTTALLLEGLRDSETLATCIAAHAEAMETSTAAELDATTREVLTFVRRGLVLGLLRDD